jgi:uncharacterized protein YjbI with pentapeptide repeats
LRTSTSLKYLKQGAGYWNHWRKRNPDVKPDLAGADLTGIGLKGSVDFSEVELQGANFSGLSLAGSDFKRANLRGSCLERADLERADFTGAELGEAKLTGAFMLRSVLRGARLRDAVLARTSLYGANLEGANLQGADMKKADLAGADLHDANLSGADMTGASLVGAYLFGVNLSKACLLRADLQDANLQQTNMVGTDLRKAKLSHCSIYGSSIWDAKLEGAIQNGLVVTRTGAPAVIVDRIELAPFIHLLIGSVNIQKFAKFVLILGHFTAKRKDVLDGIQDQIRCHDYLPVLFDFDRTDAPGFDDMISNLARIARFVIIDLTETPVSYAEILVRIENIPVPVKPLLMKQEASLREPWPAAPRPQVPLLDLYLYKDASDLVANFRKEVIAPAEAKLSAFPASG